ncbi:PhoD-like phosphatase-domain-containing protein [Aspergillus karnatakaensis]|uniref:alkaline phosphatase D family protein n=1 Tax=Aspergillus karnatakaensis TaxID=1810916 RepID=UPI003CCD3DA2
MQVSRPFLWLLDGLTIAFSLWIRYKAVLFVRHQPWGEMLLEEIVLLWLTYCVLWVIQWLGSDRQSVKLEKSSLRRSAWGLCVSITSGRFDRRLQSLAFASLAATTLFPIMALDFVYRAQILHSSPELAFSRMGYVSDNTANVIVRYPEATVIQIEYRPLTSKAWLTGDVISTIPADDYVGTFKLEHLEPATEYQYRTNTSHVGTFSTPSFDPKRFTIVSSSCIKPGFPYNPVGHPLHVGGLTHLTTFLQSTKVDMMLFLGDFIYIDLPRRFGFAVEDYQKAYRQVYASPTWTPELRALPWIHAYDDHELTNNWSSNETGLYQKAIRPFLAYQHQGNPDPVKEGATYYTFSKGNVSFFVLDTRRYRSLSSLPDDESKTMLGAEQLSLLKTWLRTAPGWKVVLSSVPFTRNFQAADEEDYWAGYLTERREILEVMWETEGVLIITGDRHEHATTAFPAPGTNDTRVIEFSTSPLSQFVNPFVKDYSQVDESDRAIYYHHEGLSKFGSFTFDTSDSKVWTMEFELIVDGEKAWSYTVEQRKPGSS